MANLIIELCPLEPRASLCTMQGESVLQSEFKTDILDCTTSGDCQDACEYVRDQIGVEFRIVARNASGEYENRLATDAEKSETARAIYFDSDADFSDISLAETYLIWDAANALADESQDEES